MFQDEYIVSNNLSRRERGIKKVTGMIELDYEIPVGKNYHSSYKSRLICVLLRERT